MKGLIIELAKGWNESNSHYVTMSTKFRELRSFAVEG